MSRILAAFVVLLLLAGPAQAARPGQDSRVPPATPPAGQTATPPAVQPAAAPDPATDLPVSLSRIRKELATKPVLKLDLPDDDIPRFYVNVNATPDIQAFLKGADLVNGPVPGAPPTFNDMMGLWTPKELYSSAGFDGLSLLTAGAFNAALYYAHKAFVALANAKSEHERQAIREEIKRELAELEKLNAQKKKPGGEPKSQ
jgi:hypothetical protein